MSNQIDQQHPDQSPFKAPTPEELQAGLGRDFTVEALIGLGGMAAVYKGIDHSENDSPIAIKLLPEEIAKRSTSAGFDYQKRFEREARAMSCLNHPNIVRVFKYGETTTGLLFFTMEFIEGENLYNLVRHPGLTHDHMFSWLLQICDGLAYAHEQGLVHRDIKPGNILINPAGCAKIADFGLVKVDGRDSMHCMNTMVAMGTPEYSAPEITDSMKKGDHRADIFSVGILAYQLFTGSVPKGLWDPPSELVEGLDRRVDRIIDSALRANPDKRYQNISEMADDLRKIAPERITGLAPVSSSSVEVNHEQLHQQYFQELPAKDFKKLIQASTIETVEAGEMIVERNLTSDHLIWLAQGKVSVMDAQNNKLADLTPGSFIGEMSYLTGNRPNATVIARTDCRYLSWSFSNLRKLCSKNDKIKSAIDSKISSDLVEKLA